MSEELGIKTKRSENFGMWYLEVVKKCDIVDKRYPVKGFPVYMPWALFIIRRINASLESKLEATGHKPIAFPVVIPESSLKKESEHMKSFEENVFWVTHAGKNKLDERLFLRPTSETAFYPMYSIWIRSHADLPLKLYQTCQVYRYETKMTKPLLRGREFFWLESHTVQKSHEDVRKQIKEDMIICKRVFSDELGIPFLLFERPEWDKFPGAKYTYAYDTLLPDGESLQISTTHDLGQKFAKAFNIKFTDDKGKEQYAYQTCLGPGVSRILGAIVSTHGDNKGLILPPSVAPIQIVIVPILMKGKEKAVIEKSNKILKLLRKFRIKLDDRKYRPGFKFNEWEMRGVPLRIEIGPKDVKSKQLTIVRRDTNKRITVPENKAKEKIEEILESIFKNLKKRAEKNFKSNIREAGSFAQLKRIIEEKGGFVKVGFCSISKKGEKCAEKIEKKLGAKIRGVLFDKKEKPGNARCVVCNNPAKHVVYIAKAY